ncbi:Glutathione reductase [Basidiobolus ranarum]|uniref:Glutathione reductase n=1 Tax=Basidiobolus ranarum TaxID=34480 RepID=A0ABR2WR14_9FUNG
MIQETILKEMENTEINVIKKSSVKGLERKNPNGPITAKYSSEDKDDSIQVDTVLWAIGRVPNIEDLNLEKNGIRLSEKGYIVCDEY